MPSAGDHERHPGRDVTVDSLASSQHSGEARPPISTAFQARALCAMIESGEDAAENGKFTKERAGGRIDGAVGAAIAGGRILAYETGPSPYETLRLLFA